MGGCMSKPPPAITTAPWSELPREIAGLVFCRLPSHDDRRSFSAVCHGWRLAARQHSPLPWAIPCINLGNGTYQSVVDGKVRRFPVSRGYRAGASFGDWVLYCSKGSGGRRRFLGSPDSSIVVPPCYRKSRVNKKMIVCSSRLVVALFRHRGGRYFPPVSYLVYFRPALLQPRWTVYSFVVQPQAACIYTDIAFYHGKVYALSCWEQLFCHDCSIGDGDANSHLHPIVSYDVYETCMQHTNCHLVVSSDKKRLLMVRWRRNYRQAMDLWVFEADFDTGRWSEVADLGDQVLFVSRNCSMAFAAGSSGHWGQKFQGGNRVFVLGIDWARSSQPPISNKRDIPTYCLYDMTSGETSLVSLKQKGTRYTESLTSGWFFPH